MAYEDLVIDQKTPQAFFLSFADLRGGYNVASSLDGDFTTDPIIINRPFMTGQNFKCGNTAASDISCSFENSDGRFTGYPFAEAAAFIGVKYSESVYANAGQMAEIEVLGSTAFEVEFASISGIGNMVINNVVIPDTATTAFAAVHTSNSDNPGTVYFVDDNGKARKFEVSTSTDTIIGDPYHLFAVKAGQENKIVHLCEQLFDTTDAPYSSFTVFENDLVTVYQVAPVGVFDLVRPTSTTSRTIEITSAPDKMHRLDRVSGDFVQWVKQRNGSSCTIEHLRDELNAYFGTGVDIHYNGTYPNATVRLDWMDNYSTARDIVGWLAEAMGCNAWYNNSGDLWFVDLPDATDPPYLTIPAEQIVSDGYERADYAVLELGSIELYKGDGSFWQSGSTQYSVWGNNYVISGNPLLTESTLQDVDYIDKLQRYTYNQYHPLTVELTELNPMLLPGELVEVENIYTGVDELIPVWEISIAWSGKTYGTIKAGGTEYRVAE